MKTGYFKKLEYDSIQYNIVQEDGTAYHKYYLRMDPRTMWVGQGVQSGGPDGVIYNSGSNYIYKNTGVNYQDIAKVTTKIRNPVEGSAVIGITNGKIDILKDPGSIFNEWDYCVDIKDDPNFPLDTLSTKNLVKNGGVYKETIYKGNIPYQRWCFPLNLGTKAYKLNTIGAQLKNITNAKKIITLGYDTNPTSYILQSDGKYLKIFGESDERDIPKDFDKKIIDYGFGNFFSAALLENGYVTGWGYGITGLNKIRIHPSCVNIENDNSYKLRYPFSWPSSIQGKVSGIFIGNQCALALTNDGFLTGWGYSLTNVSRDNCSYDYTYSKNSKTVSFPSFLSGQIKKVAVSKDTDTTLVLLKNGTMTGFGETFSNNNTTIQKNCSKINQLYSGYIDDFSSEGYVFIIRSGNLVFAYAAPDNAPRNFYIDYTIGAGVKRYIDPKSFIDVLKIDTNFNVPQNFYSKISGDSPFSLNITSNNNTPEPIQYVNTNSNIASGNQNGLVTLKGIGDARIFLIQLGNEYFNPSEGKSTLDFYNDSFKSTKLLNSQIISINVRDKSSQEITFSSNTIVKNLVEHKNPFLLATINSTLPITYTGYDSNIVEINSGYATIKNTGTTIITGIQTGDQYHYPAQIKSGNLIVITDRARQDLNLNTGTVQDLTEDLTIQKTYNDPIFYLPSVSNVGLNINYNLGSDSVAKIINSSGIMLLSAGIEQITAKQDGNDYYYPDEKIINLTVNKDNQTITFPSIPSQKFRKSIFYITGSSDSNLKLNYLISNSGIARIVGASGIKMLKTGTFQISGTEPGNDYYEAAIPVVRNFTILKGNQTIKL